MHGRRIAQTRSRRTPSRRRRLPAALVAGIAVLLAAPLLGSNAPWQQIMGISATAEPSTGPVRAVGDLTAAHGRVMLPDPAGDRSVPGMGQAPAVDSLTGYRWPLHNARLTQAFGPSPWGTRIVNGEPFHDGLDLATFCGDRVRAAHAGTVLAAGRHFDDVMGWVGDLTAYKARLDEQHLWLTLPNVVVIDDGNGYRSIYAHLRKLAVAPGDVVSAGDYLGTEGMTGRASGCHLHYGLFSPHATTTFGFDPVAAAHMLLPTEELARIDPLLVLPPGEDVGIH